MGELEVVPLHLTVCSQCDLEPFPARAWFKFLNSNFCDHTFDISISCQSKTRVSVADDLD